MDIAVGEIPALLSHPLLAGQPSTRLQLENTYFDTPDRQIQAKNMGLRTRFDGSGWLQTLKRKGDATDGLHIRDEWEVAIGDDRLEIPKFAQAGASAQLIAWLGGLTLIPLFTTRFERQCWLLEQRRTRVELVLDQGEVSAAGQVAKPLCEIELELKQGDLDGLQRVLEQLRAAVKLTPSDISKAARGYRLIDGQE